MAFMLAGQADLTMVPVALAAQYRDKVRFYGVASLQRNEAPPDCPPWPSWATLSTAIRGRGVLAPPATRRYRQVVWRTEFDPSRSGFKKGVRGMINQIVSIPGKRKFIK